MSEELEKARKELDETYAKVQEDLGKVFVAFEALRDTGAEDDVYAALEHVEKELKDVRTGGFIGSGAKKHRKAREKWLELRETEVQ